MPLQIFSMALKRTLAGRELAPVAPLLLLQFEERNDVGDGMQSHVDEARGQARVHELVDEDFLFQHAVVASCRQGGWMAGMPRSGLREQHHAVSFQNPLDLVQRLRHVGSVMKGVETARLRERPIREGQSFHVSGHQAMGAVETCRPQLQHVPGNVERDRPHAATAQPVRDPARSRAEIEHQIRRPQTEHAQDHREVEQVLGVCFSSELAGRWERLEHFPFTTC